MQPLRLQYRLRSMIAMKMMKLLRKKIEDKAKEKVENMTELDKLKQWKEEKEEAMNHPLVLVISLCQDGPAKRSLPCVVHRINPAGDWLEGISYEVLYTDGSWSAEQKELDQIPITPCGEVDSDDSDNEDVPTNKESIGLEMS